jgi:hypothetical protein
MGWTGHGLGALAIIAVCATACTTAADGEAASEAAVTPKAAGTLWELAGFCEDNITRHKAVRQQELASGNVRWQCGDRPQRFQ